VKGFKGTLKGWEKKNKNKKKKKKEKNLYRLQNNQ
jgi:hypothetical protein